MKAGPIVSAVLLAISLPCEPGWSVQGPESSRWTEPAPLTEVNSNSAEEWSPHLSFDGLTLHFVRVRSDTFYYGRVFKATREEPFGPFTSVQEVNGTLNSSPGHVLLPWISPDELRMYYVNQLGSTFTLKLSERLSIDAAWPEGTGISEVNKLAEKVESPRLTADELTILFDSYEIGGGKGGYDIWTASRPDRNSRFKQVRNL